MREAAMGLTVVVLPPTWLHRFLDDQSSRTNPLCRHNQSRRCSVRSHIQTRAHTHTQRLTSTQAHSKTPACKHKYQGCAKNWNGQRLPRTRTGFSNPVQIKIKRGPNKNQTRTESNYTERKKKRTGPSDRAIERSSDRATERSSDRAYLFPEF